jgi:lipopolysaccharide heptosyltransferase II
MPADDGKRRRNDEIDWTNVKRVLVVRLRSIGDTVLATPSLAALRRFLPDARIDILLEDWVAPLLEGSDDVDHIITVEKGLSSRLRTALEIRRTKYDVAFNLHGGTTGTFFTAASGARERVGFSYYQYSFLYSRRYPSGEQFWNSEKIHSAEQQLALLGAAGVPVRDRPRAKLPISQTAVRSLGEKLRIAGVSRSDRPLALFHPAAAFETKQWAAENFAAVARHLAGRGFAIVAVATRAERQVLEKLRKATAAPVAIFEDLTLPEITALSAGADIFVGNDSGIAHIAAAIGIPSVVVFGSSNIDNWRPWTKAPNRVVSEILPCQPCDGYVCREFGRPKCILSVAVPSVIAAVESVLSEKRKDDQN